MTRNLLFVFAFCTLATGMNCDSNKEVYICTGPQSKVYHKTDKCRGLNRCSGDIKAVKLEDVKGERRACRICY